MKQFLLDEMDLEFVLSVKNILEDFLGTSNVTDILERSCFMTELRSNPEYVYHFDEMYWAELVRKEYLSNMNRIQ